MSTNEAHFAAIREALDAGYDPLDDWEYLSGKSREEIDYHLAQLEGHASDARAMENNLLRELAEARRQRDEATARAEKLRIERDALRDAGLVDMRRYARAVELKWWNEVNDRANGHPDTENLVEDLRSAYGVAGLMDAAPGDTAGERG